MTRDEILEAATQIFGQKGFHATSMQDIAEAVNLQKASLYYHISSKQEILVEVLDRAIDVLTERLYLGRQLVEFLANLLKIFARGNPACRQ